MCHGGNYTDVVLCELKSSWLNVILLGLTASSRIEVLSRHSNDSGPEIPTVYSVLPNCYTVKGHNLTFFRPVAVSLYRRVGFIQGHPHL